MTGLASKAEFIAMKNLSHQMKKKTTTKNTDVKALGKAKDRIARRILCKFMSLAINMHVKAQTSVRPSHVQQRTASVIFFVNFLLGN